jgi:hypothetical protein
MALVLIQHKDGRDYAIEEADFDRVPIEGDKTYKDLGFKIIRYQDGSPYHAARTAKEDG